MEPRMKRYWIDAPSKHSHYHRYHGTVVLAHKTGGVTTAYLMDITVPNTSFAVPSYMLRPWHSPQPDHKICFCTRQSKANESHPEVNSVNPTKEDTDDYIERLRYLSHTMRDYSDTAGDHHWQAHLAIERLIKLTKGNVMYTQEQIQDAIENGIAIKWSIDDVKSIMFEQAGINVEDELAARVLLHAKQHHDANYGITWEHLVFAYDAVTNER